MTNYTKIAVKGTITVLVVSLVTAFLGYLVRLILARNLTIEEFGLFYAVFAFLGLTGIFKSFGFDKALIKFIPEFKHNGKNNFIKSSIIYVLIIQLITNSVIIILIYLFSNYLSVHFFHNTQASIVLKLIAIAFFIDSFVFLLKFSFQGFQKMGLYAGIDLVRMMLMVIITYIGFRLNYKILSPIFAYMAVPFILILIFTPILIKKVFPQFINSKFILDIPLIKKISKYSVFVLSTGLGGMILGYTDFIILTYFSGLKSVGLYAIALPTASVLRVFPTAIMGILIPLTSELWVKKKKILVSAGMESVFKYSIIIITPLVLIMFSFPDLLITLLFGSEYTPANNALRILCIGMMFGTLCTANSSFFSGIGKPQINTKIIFTVAFFNLISNLILVPLWGIIGAALTTTISLFIMMLMWLRNIRKFIKITLPIKIWTKTLVIGAILVFIIWFLKKVIFLNVWLEVSIVLITSGLCYIALLFLLKVVDINELRDLYNRIVK